MGEKVGVILLWGLLFTHINASAQEFNCKVTINSERIEGTYKQMFVALQEKLTEFVNNRTWTDARFAPNERINCNLTIVLSEAESNERFKGEIQVQANRPVFNTSYLTPIFNFRDTEFNFTFNEFQQLEYNEQNLDSNLTAVVVFYLHILLGIDFDTFSPLGGTPYFQQAMNIVNLAQTLNEPGWTPFAGSKNRYALASDLIEEGSHNYRTYLYTYHRQGLDEMALNTGKGRKAIGDGLEAIKDIYAARPSSSIPTLFAETKLDELVNIYSKATNEDKEQVYKLLSGVYPTYDNRLTPLKNR